MSAHSKYRSRSLQWLPGVGNRRGGIDPLDVTSALVGPSLIPWWEYFVGVMLVKACREFEDRVGATGARRGAKRDMIRDVVSRLPSEFRYADLERALPAVSRPTIARALRELSAEGVVRCVGRGRDATWERIPPQSASGSE